MTLPNDLILKEMAKIAIEQATEMFANMALEMSLRVPTGISGKEALVIFAKSIRETNLELYGKGLGS
ncbi:hypothetical protein EVB56_025 [Rhizobium phage RHph_Y1_10]|nr:hypothetical protein EVB56_025 [Rhizobium phage RHph_Y1_10]